MNQCWISGQIVEHAKVLNESELVLKVRTQMTRICGEVEIDIMCKMTYLTEDLADYLVSGAKGSVIEFSGEIVEVDGVLSVIFDSQSFRFLKLPGD